jgi:hypothetical protein
MRRLLIATTLLTLATGAHAQSLQVSTDLQVSTERDDRRDAVCVPAGKRRL